MIAWRAHGATRVAKLVYANELLHELTTRAGARAPYAGRQRDGAWHREKCASIRELPAHISEKGFASNTRFGVRPFNSGLTDVSRWCALSLTSTWSSSSWMSDYFRYRKFKEKNTSPITDNKVQSVYLPAQAPHASLNWRFKNWNTFRPRTEFRNRLTNNRGIRWAGTPISTAIIIEFRGWCVHRVKILMPLDVPNPHNDEVRVWSAK